MPRDVRMVATYVVAGMALAAMLGLAPFFFASGLIAPGRAVGVFIRVWLVLFGLRCAGSYVSHCGWCYCRSLPRRYGWAAYMPASRGHPFARPVLSAVQHSEKQSYSLRSAFPLVRGIWRTRRDSNPQPSDASM
jgi:hypothetical protein